VKLHPLRKIIKGVLVSPEHTPPPCEQCQWRKKYEIAPNSFSGRLWRWHTMICPGWKKYMTSLTPSERNEIAAAYNLKNFSAN